LLLLKPRSASPLMFRLRPYRTRHDGPESSSRPSLRASRLSRPRRCHSGNVGVPLRVRSRAAASLVRVQCETRRRVNVNDKESRITPKGMELVSPAFEGLPEHWRIASRAVEDLSSDDRVLGLYLAGPFASG